MNVLGPDSNVLVPRVFKTRMSLLVASTAVGNYTRTIGRYRDIRILVTFSDGAQLLTCTVVHQPGLRGPLSCPVEQFAIGRGGEGSQPEQCVKGDMVCNGRGGSTECSATWIERLEGSCQLTGATVSTSEGLLVTAPIESWLRDVELLLKAQAEPVDMNVVGQRKLTSTSARSLLQSRFVSLTGHDSSCDINVRFVM